MSDEPDLNPQEPGENPQASQLEALLAGELGDLVEALPSLSEADIETLSVIEQQGAGRALVLDAIARERMRREEEAPLDDEPVVVTAAPNIAGDASSYADMHASEIDATKLMSPVLTKEGWLLPAPSAPPVVFVRGAT